MHRFRLVSFVVLIALLSFAFLGLPIAFDFMARLAVRSEAAGLAALLAGPANGGFETGDLSGWTVPPFHETHSIAGHVEVLAASNFSPVITPTGGTRFALLCNGPGTVCSGNSFGDIDGNGTLDGEVSILSQTFTLGAGEVPAILAFDWSFLTAESDGSTDPGSSDDVFQVKLNGTKILTGSVPGGGVSPYPDVAVDGLAYTVSSPGLTNGCTFSEGRSPFSTHSVFIDATGTYTVEFLVADQANAAGDSGLLVDNVRLAHDPCDRSVAGVFTVTNTADSGAGSLRQAILDANGAAGRQRIAFNIPGPGPHTIQPLSALPVITDEVVVDGYTQLGAVPATATDDAIPKIVLDGSQAGNGVNGLVLETELSQICGLNIHSFRVTDVANNDFTQGNGIVVREGMTNTIAGNFIGTNVTGTACAGNGGSGVLIGGPDSTASADDNTVGGRDPEDRNVITCNGFQDQRATGWDGVSIRANHVGTFYSADSNTVIGNYIGTDVTGAMTLTAGTDISGTVHIGNTGNGVRIAGGSSNIVGGTTPGERNIISGNYLAGVRIEAVAFDNNVPPQFTRGANNNVVHGNYIGTDVNGTGDLGNIDVGVYIVGLVDDADNNTVGGTTAAERNLISGNGGGGVMILGGQADHNTVQGNYVGTNVNGTAAIANGADGINITDAEDNRIGGTTPEERNLVSGNGGHGISIANSPRVWNPGLNIFRGSGDASGNVIQGNYVGTDVNGTGPLSNMLTGVAIMDAAGNTVGGTRPGEPCTGACNLISGNGQNGVLIMNAYPPGNTETDVVTAEGPGSVSGSDSATVTITDQPGAMEVTKTANPAAIAAPGDVVTFTVRITNTHGVDVTIKRLSDSIHGDLNGRGTCLVPQTLADTDSYSCTFSAAVFGFGPGGKDETDTVTASGTDVNGDSVMDSDSATVNIGPAPAIRVTKTAYPTNLTPPGGTVNFTVTVKNISGSSVTISKMWDTKHGKLIPDGLCGPILQVSLNHGDTFQCTYSDTVRGATGNTIEGNYLGADVSGTAALSNMLSGLLIINAPDNTIGGDGHGPNLIAGNAREGVFILGAGATGNWLHNNPIGVQLDYSTPLPNGTHGVLVAGGASDNEIDHNSIRFHAGAGVVAHSGTGTYLWNNGIDDNGGLGIDLGADGVTANDHQDPDPGPNMLQNYPLLIGAQTVGLNTQVKGMLNSTPNTQFRVEYFESPACDPSGFGEGRSTLSGQTVTTDGTGNASVDYTVSPAVPSGHFVTATATDPYGNTSEFSNCIPVPSAPALTINKQVQDLNGGAVLPGDTLVYTINYSNTGNAPASGVFIEDTYSISCTIISNVTNGDLPGHNDNGTRLRWPATGGIVLNAQASGSVSYRCTLDDSFPHGTSNVDNTATIDSDQTTPQQAALTVPVTVAAVLTIDKECTPATGNSPGDTVHCVIGYANTGDAYATGVTIVDDYDQSKGSVSGITGSAHFGVGTDNNDTITWGPSTILAGQSGQVEYDYDLAGAGTFPHGTTPVTNTATIDSDDTVPVADLETIQITAAAVLTIDKVAQDANGGNAEPGDTLQYTINYTNTGDAPASGVFITDDYSDLCDTIKNVTTDANFPTSSNTAGVLRWPQDPSTTTLAAGASGFLTYECELLDPFPAGTTRVTNTGIIDSNEAGPAQDTETLFTVCYDFNGNGVVDVGDVMQVAIRWCLTAGHPDWDDKYDTNGDGVITVVDIMTVAAQWGQAC